MMPVDTTSLNVLQIRLNLTSTLLIDEPSRGDDVRGTSVLFEVTSAGQRLGLLEALPEELGVPMRYTQARRLEASEAGYRLPDYITLALADVIPRDKPLWLSLEQPTGYLPLLPWERLLHEAMGIPILRLPGTAIQPVASNDRLNIAICFSSPPAQSEVDPRSIIELFISQFPPELAARTRLHIFADQSVQGMLQDYQRHFTGYEVHLYDPGKAAAFPVPARSTDLERSVQELENPWLLWIRSTLTEHSVDVVHFVCHGFLNREYGALALAQSPLVNQDRTWARFVGPRELALFLDQVGAWSAVFSSPPHNTSIAGLRMLQYNMSLRQTGPLLLHDMTRDEQCTALGQGYSYIYRTEQTVPPNSPAISLYCHPDWYDTERSQSSEELTRVVSEFTLGDRLRSTLQGSEPPAWISAVQRLLERNLTQVQLRSAEPTTGGTPDTPDTAEASARQRGTEKALRFTADLLARHARKWLASHEAPETEDR